MTNTIITIGREFGSGGCEIGHKLAEKLGIKCYDKDMLDLAAKESGICQEIFESHDEKPTNSFLYSLVMDTYSFGYSSGSYTDMPLNHKVFLAQFDAIKKIAKAGPCVLVGRCADYILRERDDVLNVFIHADMASKINRAVTYFGITEDQAPALLKKKDKARSNHYKYYTDQDWGMASNYDLSLNSGALGIDGCVDVILKALEEIK